jgi:hypothetical protein
MTISACYRRLHANVAERPENFKEQAVLGDLYVNSCLTGHSGVNADTPA